MCSASGSPVRSPWPGSTLNTPSGTPASATSAARRIALNGERSEGLRTTELPAASAGAIFHDAINSGKFHGTITATTPTGSRVIRPSVSSAVGATSPYTLSTASAVQRRHRTTPARSPSRASRTGLPMSRVSSNASASACCSTRSASRSSTCLRCEGAARDQSPASKLRRAAATARSTSVVSASATCTSTRPSIGLMQS